MSGSQLPPRISMAEMDPSSLDLVERNADAALIFSIIVIFIQVDQMEKNADMALAFSILILVIQVMIAIFILLARLRLRGLHQPAVKPQNNFRGVPTQATSRSWDHGPPFMTSALAPTRDFVARSPSEAALDRLVVDYTSQHEWRAEFDDHYSPTRTFRPPTVDSVSDEEMHGTDYTSQQEWHSESPTPISRRPSYTVDSVVDDADYGRKGNKFVESIRMSGPVVAIKDWLESKLKSPSFYLSIMPYLILVGLICFDWFQGKWQGFPW